MQRDRSPYSGGIIALMSHTDPIPGYGIGPEEAALLRRAGQRWDDAVSLTTNPVKWVQAKTREYLWRKQREIIDSVRDHRYTAVPSAHDMGKSHIASRTIGWWIDSHPPGEAFVVSTAPSAAQVSAILWREIGKVHQAADLRGRVVRSPIPSWYIGSQLVGYGRKPADHEQSAFQGIHERYVLVVIDEAGGVAANLYDAIDSLATNEHARVLAIGNPDDPGAHFAKICKPGSGWNVIQLDALRSPNMAREQVLGLERDGFGPNNPKFPLLDALLVAEGIDYDDEDVPAALRPMLVSALWVEERIERWCGVSRDMAQEMDREALGALIRRRGEGSALFQAKVRGVFPSSTATGVIPLGWVEQAMARWRDWRDRGERIDNLERITNEVVGVDVAYGGTDETCIAHRVGDVVTGLHRYRHADTVETAEYAAVHLHGSESTAVVDVIGIGAGVYDTLRRYRREGRIASRAIPFNAAAQSGRTDRTGEFKFRNDRAAAWWKMRELLDPSRGSRIMLPDDDRLKEELVAPKYKHYLGGTILVESKDEIRKRLGRSTDAADSVIQCFWSDGVAVETLDAEDVAALERGEQPKEIIKGRRRSEVIDWADDEVYERINPDDFEVDSYAGTW